MIESLSKLDSRSLRSSDKKLALSQRLLIDTENMLMCNMPSVS